MSVTWQLSFFRWGRSDNVISVRFRVVTFSGFAPCHQSRLQCVIRPQFRHDVLGSLLFLAWKLRLSLSFPFGDVISIKTRVIRNSLTIENIDPVWIVACACLSESPSCVVSVELSSPVKRKMLFKDTLYDLTYDLCNTKFTRNILIASVFQKRVMSHPNVIKCVVTSSPNENESISKSGSITRNLGYWLVILREIFPDFGISLLDQRSRFGSRMLLYTVWSTWRISARWGCHDRQGTTVRIVAFHASALWTSGRRVQGSKQTLHCII